MVNDSDEDVVYGSDDDSIRPLNSSTGRGNDYDSDWNTHFKSILDEKKKWKRYSFKF